MRATLSSPFFSYWNFFYFFSSSTPMSGMSTNSQMLQIIVDVFLPPLFPPMPQHPMIDDRLGRRRCGPQGAKYRGGAGCTHEHPRPYHFNSFMEGSWLARSSLAVRPSMGLNHHLLSVPIRDRSPNALYALSVCPTELPKGSIYNNGVF